jgi:hypothetical protein
VAGRWISPQGYQESTAGGSGCRARMWLLRVEPTARTQLARGWISPQDMRRAWRVDLAARHRVVRPSARGRWISLLEGGIDHTLMDADVPYITLQTPPPSPGSQIRLGESTPTPTSSHLPITPIRKRCSADSCPKTKKQRHKTVVDNVYMQEQAPSWDSAGADLDMGSEPGWSSPEQPPPSSETDVPQDFHGAGYSEYCESIQDEGGALYQIAPDLFVVNGWDPQGRYRKWVGFVISHYTTV